MKKYSLQSNIDYDPVVQIFAAFKESFAITDWEIGYSTVMKSLGNIRNKKLLDYGCGCGNFSRQIADAGANVIAVDTSKKMIELLKLCETSNIEVKHIEDESINFIESNSIDNITMNFVTTSIPMHERLVKLFKEAYRVLKTRGLLVILNVNHERSNGREYISFKLNYVPNLISGQKVSETLKLARNVSFDVESYYWSNDDYYKALQSAGFRLWTTEEPLAKNNSHPWIDEQKSPPFSIITTFKK